MAARLLFFLALCGSLLIAASAAASYPERPLTLILPFPINGSPDIAGTPRISKVMQIMHSLSTPSLTDHLAIRASVVLTNQLGQAVNIERRAGGKTIIGTQQAATAGADGYTLLLAGNPTITIYPAVYPSLPVNPLHDLAPVAGVARMPIVVIVEQRNQVSNLADLIVHAHRFPGVVNFGSVGDNTTSHLAAELFASAANVKMVHVAFNGGNALLNGVLTGQIEIGIAPLPAAMPYLAGGRIRIVAVASGLRLDILPEVPTFAEHPALNGFEASGWFGVFAPSHTPTAIVSLLNYEINKAFGEPLQRQDLDRRGLQAMQVTPEEFASIIGRDHARWSRVVRSVASGIR